VLAIILGILAFLLFGQKNEQEEQPKVETSLYVELIQPDQDTTIELLLARYREFNDAYFQGKLPKDTQIIFSDDAHGMADTGCTDADGTMGIDCAIRFKQRYVLAPRHAESTLLHEMCHIKTWTKTQQDSRPAGVEQVRWDHNKFWRGCMLNLDSQGAFRSINIDYLSDGGK
jgi:hypothetical protein